MNYRNKIHIPYLVRKTLSIRDNEYKRCLKSLEEMKENNVS